MPEITNPASGQSYRVSNNAHMAITRAVAITSDHILKHSRIPYQVAPWREGSGVFIPQEIPHEGSLFSYWRHVRVTLYTGLIGDPDFRISGQQIDNVLTASDQTINRLLFERSALKAWFDTNNHSWSWFRPDSLGFKYIEVPSIQACRFLILSPEFN